MKDAQLLDKKISVSTYWQRLLARIFGKKIDSADIDLGNEVITYCTGYKYKGIIYLAKIRREKMQGKMKQ